MLPEQKGMLPEQRDSQKRLRARGPLSSSYVVGGSATSCACDDCFSVTTKAILDLG
jgi:hypothetical protein